MKSKLVVNHKNQVRSKSLIVFWSAVLALFFFAIKGSQTVNATSVRPASTDSYLQVDYPRSYGIRVYREPNNKIPTQQVLKGETMWKVVASQRNENGELFYSVGTNQWVSAKYAIYPIKKFQSVGYVDYGNSRDNKISVYSRPVKNDTPTGQQLRNCSSWKINYRMDNNGKTFYQVGQGQWVLADYISLAPIRYFDALLQVNAQASKGIPVYREAACQTPTGQTLKPKSIWRVSAAGKSSYKLGDKQWVKNSSVKVYPIEKIHQRLWANCKPGQLVYFYSIPTISNVHSNVVSYCGRGISSYYNYKVNIDGVIWYGGDRNAWIESKYLSPKCIIAPLKLKVKIVAPQGARVYAYADPAYPTKQILKPGTVWQVMGYADLGYGTSNFFQVGKNQWIRGYGSTFVTQRN